MRKDKNIKCFSLHKRSMKLTVLVFLTSIFFVVCELSVIAQVSSPNPELQTGIQLVKENRTAEAINVLRSITAESKDDAEAWYYLGVAYIQKGEFKKATSTLQTAIKLKPDLAAAHNAVGYSLMRRGKLDKAKLAVEKSLSIQPLNAEAHYTLGIINLRLGDQRSALAAAERAIQEQPTFADAYLLKSQALVFVLPGGIASDIDLPESRARYREAASALEKYLELDTNSESNAIWQEQLESLRVHGDTSKHPEIFLNKDVTTKLQLTSKPEPQYTKKALDDVIRGIVVLKAVFAGDGQVKYILVVQPLPGGLTEAAINAARRIKFVPATKDGKSVSVLMQLEYHFDIF